MQNTNDIFSFAATPNSHPTDIIQDCVHALDTLDTLFGVLALTNDDLSREGMEGVASILRGIRKSLESANQNVSDRLCGPEPTERANDSAG